MSIRNPFPSPYQGVRLRGYVKNRNIVVGDHSYYSGYYHGKPFDECALYLHPDRGDVDKLIIGKYCCIASGAQFVMSGNQGHRADWISPYPFHAFEEFQGAVDGFQRKGDTVIGNDVWIGLEALILPGIRIGDGAVVAARSIVTKEVEPYTVVAGNPAQVVRKRFCDADIKLLLRIKWWDWPQDKVRRNCKLLQGSDVQALARVQ